MDSLLMVVTGLGLVVVLSPLLMLLLTAFVLVPLAHLAPYAPMVARASFECPVTGRHVDAAFLTAPGKEHPGAVLSCSAFPGREVTCAKSCLEIAEMGWRPSAMAPRYALLAGGTALHETA